MAISSKDFESLWQRYKVEAVPAGISVKQFFESRVPEALHPTLFSLNPAS